MDFRYAGSTGSSTIKQLAVAKRTGQAVEVFVSPALVARDNFLAGIDGATNAICFAAKRSGGSRSSAIATMFWSVPARAAGPPRWQCSGDVCELARGERKFAGVPSLVPEGVLKVQPAEEIDGLFLCSLCRQRSRRHRRRHRPDLRPLGVNISEIWQLRHTEEELRALTQSYNLKEKPKEILPFVMTLERRHSAPDAQGSGFYSQSGLYPGRSGLVSDLGNEVRRGGRTAPRVVKVSRIGFNVNFEPESLNREQEEKLSKVGLHQ